MQEYEILCNSAQAAVKNDSRSAADNFREATLIVPSKRTLLRWDCFHTFACNRICPEINGIYKPTQADKKTLKRIAKDDAEPILFRAHARETLAYLKLAASDLKAAAFFFRNALDLIPTATLLEQSRCVIMLTTCEMKLVKNELECMAERVQGT